MTDKTINLDQHRGMAAQKATELRRLLAKCEANEKALRLRHDELEARLVAVPAANWREAAEKARYLLKLCAASASAQDPEDRNSLPRCCVTSSGSIAAVAASGSVMSGIDQAAWKIGGIQP
jgi:hypothetical protein